MMGPIEFVKDRALFFSLVLGYHGWKETYGPKHWEYLTANYSDFDLGLTGGHIATSIVFFGLSAFFAFIDLVVVPKRGPPAERLQPSKAHTWEEYKKAFPVIALNLGVLAYPMSYSIMYFCHHLSPFHTDATTGYYPTLPSTFVLLRDILMAMVVRDMVFYWIHRTAHHPFFYARFHKKHHEFVAPIGFSALYTGPVDFALSNILPLTVGPILLDFHPVTVWLYFAEALIETVSTHSGYNFPGLCNADMHDYHHEKFHQIFSLLGVGDWVHGTDAKFNDYLIKKQAAHLD